MQKQRTTITAKEMYTDYLASFNRWLPIYQKFPTESNLRKLTKYAALAKLMANLHEAYQGD